MAGFTVTRRGLAANHGESVGVAQLPASVVTASSPGGGHAVSSTILLDTYYDAAVFANKTTAINAAVTAAQATGGTIECRHARVYSLDTGSVAIAPGAGLTIKGNRATLQANWGKPGCIDFVRVNDYDTFADITIDDLIFDANNQTSGVASNQAIVGNLTSIHSQRINATRVKMRRCGWINVPTGTTFGYQCFSLSSKHLAAGETQTQLTDIRLEDCTMRGGNVGAAVLGQSGGTTCEVYLDKIYLDVDHDALTVPTAATAAAAANCQVGGVGFGDNCEIHIKGANSADVGLEVDGMQTTHVYGTITDSRNAMFFCRNFHAPIDVNSQRFICHGTKARVINLNPDVSVVLASGYQFGHTSSPNPTFGEAVLEDCSFYSAATNYRAAGQAILVPANALISAVTIVGTFTASIPTISDATGSAQTPSVIFIAPATAAGFTLGGGGNVRVKLGGTVTTNIQSRTMLVTPQTGCAMIVDLGNIGFSISTTGNAAGNVRGLLLGLSGLSGGSMRGRIRRVGWDIYSADDSAPQLIRPVASTVMTFDGRLVFDEVDLRKDPAASPLVINTGGAIDATNKAALPVRSANMPTYPIASAAMGTNYFVATNFTTATGNQYIGALPAEIQFATGTGAAVTAIDVSKDGTTYENAYTQASGAMAQSVVVPLENGDFVKVTFATTQPTARVRFRRVQ